MKSSQFKKSQLNYLASLLYCKPGEIEYLCDNIRDYYDKWIEQKIDKVTGLLKTYPDGTPKQRVIRPSFNKLKQIQKSIKINILGKVELPENIQGGVKKKTNITNAKKHQGNKYQFATDLQDFFPSVTHTQIYNLFLSLGYSNHIAHWLTKLTSIEFELPQGTPTSTAIANLVFYEIDKKLIALSKANNLTYTRFVDDLTFSSGKDFRPLTNRILDLVRAGGFKISYRKTKYKGNQTLTGIEVFNNYIDAPGKIKSKAKEESKSGQPGNRPYTQYLERIRQTNKNVSKGVVPK
jgi:RNA-directed DNA polymerase